MLRVTAYIDRQVGDVYTVKASAEGVSGEFTFDIKAKSDNEAAMEAIRRVERFEKAVKAKEGVH